MDAVASVSPIGKASLPADLNCLAPLYSAQYAGGTEACKGADCGVLGQVNAFFLKYILWVPPLNPLNTYRLVLLFALAVPAVREWCAAARLAN